MTTAWQSYTPEQRAKYLAKDKNDRLTKAQAKREDQRRREMLASFLRAKTPAEKRAVITTFNPYYFTFGETLDPRPRKEEDHEEQMGNIL